ncbi:MAG: hypothetical protein JHD35_02510 [Sphingopyxis sp.]|nr:hypothetical protein [Sphingopyxis sp.]
MSRYKVWQVGAGAVELQVRTLRPFVMSPMLRLMLPGPDIDIPFATGGPFAIAAISAANVATLRSAPTSNNPPSLLFACGAAKAPGAPDDKWGWCIRVVRSGTPLPVCDDEGTSLPLDPDGWLCTALRSFPTGKSVAMGFDIITFA